MAIKFLVLSALVVFTASCRIGSANLNDIESGSKQVMRLVHYNIKELTTEKLIAGRNVQVNAAADWIKKLDPDFVSLNEVQYDLKDIPIKGLPGDGANLSRFLSKAELTAGSTWNYVFGPANTGKRALRDGAGNYPRSPGSAAARARADQVSFGVFPGQYSTGFASRRVLERAEIITDLQWKQWNPSLDLAKFTGGDGSNLPEDMELFDKNFNVARVKLQNTEVAVILLHAVPAFNFGNSKSPNAIRNKDQLEFLEWFILGACEYDSDHFVKSCKNGIEPLEKGTPFVVVGDLNVDSLSKDPGAGVINRIYQHSRIQHQYLINPDPAFKEFENSGISRVTYLSDGADLSHLQLQLDYVIVSSDLDIVKLEVVAPASKYEVYDCYAQRSDADAEAIKKQSLQSDFKFSVQKKYTDDSEDAAYCVFRVTREFSDFRKGSDHLPVVLDFKLD